MKKLTLLAVIFLGISLNAHAQLVQFGIKVGLNYCNFTSSSIQTNAITSYHAGFVAEIKLLDKFAIQPELLYSTQGASYKIGVTEIKNELGYIAIPVMAKIYLNKSVSLELGPQASFLLSQRNNFNATDSNTFDFAIDAGLGLKVTKSIFIQARYGLGLTEVSSSAQTKNSVIQVSAGLLF